MLETNTKEVKDKARLGREVNPVEIVQEIKI